MGVRTAFKPREASFDFARSPMWKVNGALGRQALSPRVLDFLDLVGGVYRLESQIPPRPTNPAAEWQIHAPVRDVDFWLASGGLALSSVLTFLSRARWTFMFSPRAKPHDLVFPMGRQRNVREVVLFSGGMDSTCGAGLYSQPKGPVQLVSFSTNQAGLQRILAKDLGYGDPIQWRLQGQRGKEGMDLIRAVMFLTLGAVVAHSFGAEHVTQYENGVLAMAIPPSGAMVSTRHAHPELHRRIQDLWRLVFPRPIGIRNPFALMTKREAVDAFSRAVGPARADELLLQTQTCWRLSQARVGGQPKRPGQHCGVCTPCIVRRTARPSEKHKRPGWRGYAYDLKKESVQRHPKLGLTFRAYLELISIVSSTADDHELVEELAPEARALVGGPAGPSEEQAVPLLRKFTAEFCDTFEIARGRRRA